MNIKTDQAGSLLNKESNEIVFWGEKYATGIDKIDRQHKELVKLTNELYQACLSGNNTVAAAFKTALTKLVEYVRFHFTTEIDLLNKVSYPNSGEHKKQHDTLVLQILEASKEFGEGKNFVAHNFVRTLKDWVFGHIAVSDKDYAAFIREQKSKGFLTDKQING